MPRVPVYNRQVDEQGLPAARVQPAIDDEAFGIGQSTQFVRRATNNFSDTVQKITNDMSVRADDAATSEAYTNLLKAKQDLVYNPQNGALTKRGKDAFGVSEEYGTRYEQLADSIESGLSNRRQKEIFRQMRQKEGLELSGTLQRHTAQEAERFEAETTDSTISVLQNEASLNPANAQNAIALMQGKIQDYAGKTGKSQEWTVDKLQNETSRAHSGVISSFLTNKQYSSARKYFDENKEGILPKDRERLKVALEEGDRREFGEFKAAQFQQKGVTIENLQSELDKIGDVQKRDETKRRFLDRLQLQEEAAKAQHFRTYESAYNQAMKAGTIDAISPEVIATFSAKERVEIEKGLQGDNVVTDWATKTYLADLAATNPKKFLDENPILHYSKLSPEDRNWLIKMRSEIAKDGKSASLDDFRSTNDIISNSIDEAGLSKMTKPERAHLETKIAEAQRAAQDQKGGKLTRDEMQGLVDNQLVQMRTGFFSSKRKFQLEPGQTGAIDDVDQLPPNTVRQIKESLFRQRGIKNPSDETILTIYKEVYGAD